MGAYEWEREEARDVSYEWEREEARDAMRFASEHTSCYRHDYVSDRRGGGVCRYCGDTIGANEL